jgi:hypothetical protein
VYCNWGGVGGVGDGDGDGVCGCVVKVLSELARQKHIPNAVEGSGLPQRHHV